MLDGHEDRDGIQRDADKCDPERAPACDPEVAQQQIRENHYCGVNPRQGHLDQMRQRNVGATRDLAQHEQDLHPQGRVIQQRSGRVRVLAVHEDLRDPFPDVNVDRIETSRKHRSETESYRDSGHNENAEPAPGRFHQRNDDKWAVVLRLRADAGGGWSVQISESRGW